MERVRSIRPDVAMKIVSRGIYEGHGFRLVYMSEKKRWYLYHGEQFVCGFMVKRNAINFVEQFLDVNEPSWRRPRRDNPVK